MTRVTSLLSRSDVSCNESDEDTKTNQHVGERNMYRIKFISNFGRCNSLTATELQARREMSMIVNCNRAVEKAAVVRRSRNSQDSKERKSKPALD